MIHFSLLRNRARDLGVAAYPRHVSREGRTNSGASPPRRTTLTLGRVAAGQTRRCANAKQVVALTDQMVKKTPRSEVVSLRLNEARLELLERYRRAFADELGRDVSLSEAAFLALEDRAV